MSVIAIAGGTGKLGRSILDALKAVGGHQVFVLARESTPEKEAQIGAKILAVDYTDVAALTRVLETNHIDTLISTINSYDGTGPDMMLIDAAEKSEATKRFIPSQWGIAYTKEILEIFPKGRGKMEVAARLEDSPLEWSSINIGFFADYFLNSRVPSYLQPMPLFLDISSNVAAIPGDGNTPVALTHSTDVAAFVARLVGAPAGTWSRASVVVGDKVTFNQLLHLVESAKGTKFAVSYDSVEALRKGEMTELPGHVGMYRFMPKPMLRSMFAAFGIMFASGLLDVKTDEAEESLNRRFTEMKTKSMKELVDAAWKE